MTFIHLNSRWRLPSIKHVDWWPCRWRHPYVSDNLTVRQRHAMPWSRGFVVRKCVKRKFGIRKFACRYFRHACCLSHCVYTPTSIRLYLSCLSDCFPRKTFWKILYSYSSCCTLPADPAMKVSLRTHRHSLTPKSASCVRRTYIPCQSEPCCMAPTRTNLLAYRDFHSHRRRC